MWTGVLGSSAISILCLLRRLIGVFGFIFLLRATCLIDGISITAVVSVMFFSPPYKALANLLTVEIFLM